MYYIYEIPGVKIGCSLEPKARVKAQGYSNYNIIEMHDDPKIAGDRELELQKEYRYPIDSSHYIVSLQNRAKGRSKLNLSKEHYSKMGKKGGLVKNNSFENYSKAGSIACNKKNAPNKILVECPYCKKTGKMPPMKRWHFENCKHK
jgi:hypothetical protein